MAPTKNRKAITRRIFMDLSQRLDFPEAVLYSKAIEFAIGILGWISQHFTHCEGQYM
jgi:hypothetical protein